MLLDAQQIVKRFGGLTAVNHVSLKVDAGEIPIEYCWIKYESLHRNLAQERLRIYEFLQIDPHMAKPLNDRTKPGLDQIDNTSIYRRGEAGVWSEYMTEEQLSWFMEDAEPAMEIIETTAYPLSID